MPLACHPGIAFDRGEAYTEEADSLRFGYPALEGFDYLCAKISRIGSHSSMIASGSMLLTDAVDQARASLGDPNDPKYAAGRALYEQRHFDADKYQAEQYETRADYVVDRPDQVITVGTATYADLERFYRRNPTPDILKD